ncbi:MAG: superoxide dismutase family protein [Neisseriaceae bacterium]|nr:MAG: superoxide dismutase family protein [Neisseriaceae bacterium]
MILVLCMEPKEMAILIMYVVPILLGLKKLLKQCWNKVLCRINQIVIEYFNMRSQNKIFTCLSLVLIVLVACSFNQSSNDIRAASDTRIKILGTDEQVIIPLEAKNGSRVIGTVEISVLKEGTVLLQLKAKNVLPGLHAIHIHENPDCSSDDASSAGGRWNPTRGEYHRSENGGYHRGDVGVFLANKDGNVDYTFKTTTNSWCIGCNDATRNILGHSVVLHSHPDNSETQLMSNAGEKIACGIIY